MSASHLKILKKALQLEHEGMSFYSTSMEKSTSRIGQQMFDYLRLSEKDHIKRISDIYHQLEQSGSWPENETHAVDLDQQRQTIFSEALAQLKAQNTLDSDDLDALRQAAEFERNGEQFYAHQAQEAQSPFEQAFYQQLALEEARHLRAIEESIQMLEDPQGFFAHYEKGTLAG